MKGVKEQTSPPKTKLVAKTSIPSELTEIMHSISLLTKTIGTLITDRNNDRVLLEANMKSINDIKFHKSSSRPTSPIVNPLDHLDDDTPTTRRAPRRSVRWHKSICKLLEKKRFHLVS